MSNIWVTGGTGLVGSNINQHLTSLDIYNIKYTSKKECNLLETKDIGQFLWENNKNSDWFPDIVIHCAAKAGGIGANMNYNADQFYENITINSNILDIAAKLGVKKVIIMSSVSVFDTVEWPLTEEDIFIGDPYPGDFGYGWAKRMIDVQCRTIKSQYGYDYCQLFLTNTYGPYDNFNLENGHLIPSLLHKLYLAQQNNTNLEVWGDGTAKREFIYVQDIASIVGRILELNKFPNRLIVSTSQNISIHDLIDKLRKVTDFKNDIYYNITKPNGQSSRKTNNSNLMSLLPDFKFTSLEDGLSQTWKWLNDNYHRIRN